LAIGATVAVAGTAVETLAIYPLAHVAPVVSLGVVYLIGVVVVSTYWGIRLGFATALLSALAYNYFHLPPIGRLNPRRSSQLGRSGVVPRGRGRHGLVADLARARAEEADRRRREADLATEMARTLLAGADLGDSLAVTAQRIASAIGASSAAIELGVIAGDDRRSSFALREGDRSSARSCCRQRSPPTTATASSSASFRRCSRSWQPHCTAPTSRPR